MQGLTDNSSALILCLLITINRLGVDESFIRENGMIVRALDSSESMVVGEVDLMLEIGFCQFEVPFIMFNIPAMLNMLLGSPWSTLTEQPVQPALESKIYQRRQGSSLSWLKKKFPIHSYSVTLFIDPRDTKRYLI